MNVLVSAASKHGSTMQIARVIAATLVDAGVRTVVLRPEEVATLAGYDGVVLGSAIYAGRWLEPMKRLIDRESVALASRPVWLFSSGPAGDPPKPEGDPADAAEMLRRTGARDHRVFAGAIDKQGLGLVERAMIAAVRAPDGDFRSWESVREWAEEIARTLRAGTPATAAS